jgi:enoyl-CoA hydratase/carnithine racemase
MTEASDGGVLLSEDLGPVRRLTLNRPGSLNALSAELMDALEAAFDAAADDDDVRVVVLRGAGRAFCAGYDLNQDAEEGIKDAAQWNRELDRDTKRLLRILVLPRRRHRPDARLRPRRGFR